MSSLENITPQSPNTVGIWGFHGPITVQHVAAAVKQIADQLNGAGHKIHIMSGTHGYCAGKVGAVATRDERFAQEDRQLVSPRTADNHPVTLVVHDFNNQVPKGPDPITAVMAKLNQDIRALVPTDGAALNTFLLAYCCSAGTR
jgi:hypothetical protein